MVSEEARDDYRPFALGDRSFDLGMVGDAHMNAEAPKTYPNVPCNGCGGDRNHALRTTFPVHGAIDETDHEENPLPFDVFETLQCLGCGAITIRRVTWNGGECYPDPDGDGFIYADESITYLPPRTSRVRPQWLSSLPKELESLLAEIYSALDVGAITLVAIGVRTVLDMMAAKAVGDVGTFEQKLEALEKKGWLGALDRKRIAIVIDAGSAAAHRGFRATPVSIGHMMEAVEHLLKSRYVLDPQAKALKKSTPPRRRRAKPKP
jgi:hypothetical protein